MGDNPSNPKPQSTALIVYQSPSEILRNALRLPQFQLTIPALVVQKCPFENLNVTVEFFYYYADGTPVPKASFMVENTNGAELMAGPLNSQGYCQLTLPKGVSYRFYFHHDKAPSGQLFDFGAPYLSKAGAPVVPVPAWPASQSVIQAGPDVRFHWGYPDFATTPADPQKPLLERLALYVVSSYVPLPGADPSMVEAALILEAMLLGSHGDNALWDRLVLNRLGFALGDQSRLAQGLVAYIYRNQAATQLPLLRDILNRAGKGNAVDWLRKFGAQDLSAAADTLAQHIDGLVAALGAELERIGTAEPLDAFNQSQARYLRERLRDIPAARAKVDAVLNPARIVIAVLTNAHPALRDKYVVGKRNIVRQVRSRFPAYIPAPVTLPRIWFEVCYLYADGKLIEKAKFLVRDRANPEAIVFQESLPPGSIGYADLPSGPTYEFRFDADEPKLAWDAPVREDAVTPDTSGWLTQAISGDLFGPGRKLVWNAELALSDYDSFAGDPSLSRLLLACVCASGRPWRKAEPALDDNAGDSDKAADAAVAGLLRGLLYADKAQSEDVQSWWREISFHRLRAVRPADGPVIERVIALLHDRDNLKLDTVARWLNARGKGNAPAWLKDLKGQLAGYRDEIASNLEQALAAFDAQLKQVAEPDAGSKDKISHPNVVMASRLRERVSKLKPKEGLSEAWKVSETRLEALATDEESKKSLHVWTAAKIRDREEYKQPQDKFPARVPPKPPEIPWLELMFLYADGTPVKGAAYKLTGGPLPLAGLLDPVGFAFEIVQRDANYEYEFSADPNQFELLENGKLKAKGADAGANLVEDGIAAGVFKKGGADLVRWGSKFYTSNEDFKLAPDLSQIVDVVVRNNTPYIASERDHEEITAFLFPLTMGKLLQKADLDAVWKACSFQRLGGCLGEDGVVVRDLLYWLDQTAAPPLADAVKRLNSAGRGDAHAYLNTLYGKFDDLEKKVSDNLLAILDAFAAELGKLTAANEADVLPEMKRFVKDIDARIQPAKPDAPGKVKEALKTARDRLDALRKEPAPEYKGSAPKTELTIRQQEKMPLDPRPAAVPPALAWFDLEYLHFDNQPVEDAEYVVTSEDGLNVLYQEKLSLGFSHLVVPANLKFKYYFRRDKAFQLAAAEKCKANDGVNFPAAFANFVRNAVLLKKFKKSKMGWGDCQADDRGTFYRDTTVGKIAYNVVRDAVVSPHLFDGQAEAREMAELLHPLLLRTPACSVVAKAAPLNYKDNSALWVHAVLNRLTVALGENGRAVASMLWAVHQAKTAGADLPKAQLLAHLNSAGKGNAIRWLEGLDVLKDANRDLVKNSLESIFDKLKAELLIVKIRPAAAGGATPRRLSSTLAESYATMVEGRLTTEKPNIANNVQTAFTTLRAELKQVLDEVIAPRPGDLQKVNLLVQTQAAFPARVPAIPPWIEVQYCYNDEDPVANAQFELHGGAGLVDQGNLSAAGYAYATDIPALTTFVFKQDPNAWRPDADVANIPMYKKDEDQKRSANPTPRPGYRSAQDPYFHTPPYAANWARFPNTSKQQYNNFSGTVWMPDNLTNYDAGDYTAQPSLGRLARKCVVNNTARCCFPSISNTGVIQPNYYPEENEAVDIVRRLVWGDPPGVVPAPNNLLFWSVLVLNRVGTSSSGGLPDDESRMRKAVLLELHRSNPTLTALIEMLNSAGRGHSVGWLRQLYAQRANVEAGVAQNITSTLDDLRIECHAVYTYNKPNPPNPGPLAGWIRDAARDVRDRLAAILNGGNVANKVHQILDPIFQSLNALIPADPLNPFPYHRPATAQQLNVFVQPATPFALAEPQRGTPPLWNLAAPTAIQVAYRNTAGGDVTADYTVNGATQANRNAATNFNIGAVAGASYWFTHDQGNVAFANPYKPWTNPYLAIAQAPDGPDKLVDNFLATVGVHNPGGGAPSCFFNRNDLTWAGTDLIGRADFAARPSLGKILARSVLVNLPRVAGANDVQDLTIALERLVTKPTVRADPDEWFRAAVIFAGTLADHGAVIRGLLLRVRKQGSLPAAEFLKLMNLADGAHGNAADWLQNHIPLAADIGGSGAGLTAILNEFEAKLGVIDGLPNPPVSDALKNFLQGVIAESQTVRAAIAGNIPACFGVYAAKLDQMRQNELPIKRPAFLGLNVYQREKAAFFVESNQALTPNQKEAIDRDIKQRIKSANVVPGALPNPVRASLAGDNPAAPYNQLFRSNHGDHVYSTLLRYLDGNRGQSAKTLAPQLSQMNHREFVEFVEALPRPPWQPPVNSAWGGPNAQMGAMIQYYNPVDGTLIRYKPGGDEYQRPQAPMYSVEVTHSNAGDAMFKVDPNGNAVPFGPGDANAAPYNGAERSHYSDGVSRSGHRLLRY